MTFAQQINAALGSTVDHLSPDGNLHRFSTNGKSSDTAGWYFMPTPDVVVAGCWRSGQTVTLFADGKRKDDGDVVEAIRRARAAYREERARKSEEAANKAGELLSYSKPLDYGHPYIQQKKIHNMPWLKSKLRARMMQKSILLDMVNAHGELVGAQIIHEDGSKKFLAGTAKQGAWHWLLKDDSHHALSTREREVRDKRQQDAIIGVCEGWATGCAVAEMRGLQRVVVGFDSGNLVHVVKRLLVLYPESPIVIFADDDDANTKTGKRAGQAGADAARALDTVRISIEYPAWPNGVKPEKCSDFADLYLITRS